MGHWYDFLTENWFWGIVVGFVIGEVSSWIRNWMVMARIKVAISDELRANRFQIAQKQDIFYKMMNALHNKKYLPGRNVPMLSAVYDNHFPTVLMKYTSKERDNLHFIYSRLHICDEFLEGFEQKIKDEISGGIVTDVWSTNLSQLRDIHQIYSVTSELISAFLDGKPEDVLYRQFGKKPPPEYTR